MARAQTLKKKGRSSSSAKRTRARPGKAAKATKARTAGRRRRPTARGMVGSKGKGRNAERRGTAGGRTSGGGRTAQGEGTRGPARERTRGEGDRSRSLTGDDTGLKPEGSMPPNMVSGDATVGEQRRAAARQADGDRTNRPEGPQRRKPGARGGGDFDRDAERRVRRDDALEVGREDLTEPTLESTRGARPRGGEEGRRARARRATPRGESESADEDRARSTKLYQRSPSR